MPMNRISSPRRGTSLVANAALNAWIAVASLVAAGEVASAQQARARADEPPTIRREAFKNDTLVIKSADDIPEPASLEDLKPADIQLPREPIDPYLVTKAAGPFMVLAKAFQGPDAAKYAQVLAMELIGKHQLPSYVYYRRIHPGGSNMEGVPPVAPPDQLGVPEIKGRAKERLYDEAVVLVGDCKSIHEAETLLKKVKRIRPDCLEHIPSPLTWRKKDLSRAIVTVNPLVPSQEIYNRPKDSFLRKINQGEFSIFNNPGPFTFQITEFGGREAIYMNGAQAPLTDKDLESSPLRTAAQDAQNFAEALARNPEFRKLGLKTYVYHDRTCSRVTVGSFQSLDPQSPAAQKLKAQMMDIVMKMGLANLDTQKLASKVDPQVGRAGFKPFRLTKEDIKPDALTSAPITFVPRIIPVPE